MASIYSGYDATAHRLRIDYSYVTNADNTWTVTASAYIENLNTNQLDTWSARIYIGGNYRTVSAQTGEFQGTKYLGSWSKVISPDINGNCSVYVQGYLEPGTGGPGNVWTTKPLVTLPRIIIPASIRYLDNYVATHDTFWIGIDNPQNKFLRFFMYVNGIHDVIVLSLGQVGDTTLRFTKEQQEAILYSMGTNQNTPYEVYISSYEADNVTYVGTSHVVNTMFKPDPSQINLSKSNFNIGENITINSGRGTTDYFRHDVIMQYGTLNKTIASSINAGTTWDTDVNDDLYSQIPNAKYGVGTLVQKTYYGNQLIGQTSVQFTANVTDANPIFNDFTYLDMNIKTTALTSSNQTIVKGYSNVRAIVTPTNKAVAVKCATMLKYTFVTGTKSGVDGTYSATSNVDITINNADGNTLSVYAVDSRGYSTKKDIPVSSFIEYSPINILSLTANRDQGGIGTNTILKFNGYIWNKNFGSANNSIVSCIYKYKKTTEDDTKWVTGTTNITPVLNGDEYALEIAIVGDLGANGFDSKFSYNIQIIIADKLSSYIQSTVLQSGKPQMAFGIETGVAIGSFYNLDEGGDLQILGKNILNLLYPIGRGFIDTTDTDYSNYLGFTWQKFSLGRVPVGKDGTNDFKNVGQQGGEKSHILTVGEMPTHNHTLPANNFNMTYKSNNTGNGSMVGSGTSHGLGEYGSAGGGLAHNNLQPYEVVNYWKRVL